MIYYKQNGQIFLFLKTAELSFKALVFPTLSKINLSTETDFDR